MHGEIEVDTWTIVIELFVAAWEAVARALRFLGKVTLSLVGASRFLVNAVKSPIAGVGEGGTEE